MIKQGFKFLDSFSFSSENKPMLSILRLAQLRFTVSKIILPMIFLYVHTYIVLQYVAIVEHVNATPKGEL